jgi:hypothetical protein
METSNPVENVFRKQSNVESMVDVQTMYFMGVCARIKQPEYFRDVVIADSIRK